MKRSYTANKRLGLILAHLALVFGMSTVLRAQDDPIQPAKKIASPAAETFTKAEKEIVLPYFASACHPKAMGLVPICKGEANMKFPSRLIGPDEKYWDKWGDRYLTDLYNEDGSFWIRISSHTSLSNYFEKVSGKEIFPYAKVSGYGAPIFRLIAESANWYKVEVNFETGVSKYILKSDPRWTQANWDLILNQLLYLYSNDHEHKLFDKPGGEMIKGFAEMKFDYFNFMDKVDGDWAYVEGQYFYDDPRWAGFDGEAPTGWIRWKEDDRFLITDEYGDFKSPETRLQKTK